MGMGVGETETETGARIDQRGGITMRIEGGRRGTAGTGRMTMILEEEGMRGEIGTMTGTMIGTIRETPTETMIEIMIGEIPGGTMIEEAETTIEGTTKEGMIEEVGIMIGETEEMTEEMIGGTREGTMMTEERDPKTPPPPRRDSTERLGETDP